MPTTATANSTATATRSFLSPLGIWFEMLRREPIMAATMLAMLALVPPTLFAMAVDDRTLHGINIWIKPLKFEIALIVYTGTLAWFAGWLPAAHQRTRTYRLFSAAVATAIALEIIWIAGAAANGVASHYNVGTPFMQSVYSIMGALAVLLTSMSLVYGIKFARHTTSTLDPAFRLSLILGLILTFVLTLIAAGVLASQPNHWISGMKTDANGALLMGWSRTGGDLRVAHFFATHAMHFIPIAGYLAARTLAPSHAKTFVYAASAIFTAAVALMFVQALQGNPFLPTLI